jgi:hypothetical protein
MTTRTDGPDRPGPGGPGEPWSGQVLPVEPGDEDLLEDWTAARRTNRLTAVLAVAAVAVATFAAGAWTQQRFGAASTTTTAARTGQGLPAGQFPGGGQGFPGGAPPSGFPGGAGLPVGDGLPGGAPTGGGAPSSAGGAGSAAAGTPVVVGTITDVKGNDLVVTNFAGKAVTVHVPATATVTSPGLVGIAKGMTASVVGTKGSDGSVTATTVTARRRG